MGNTRKNSDESGGLKVNLPLLSAYISRLKRLTGSLDPEDYDTQDMITEANLSLLSDFTLAVANGALRGDEARLGASMIVEALQIRSSTH